MLVLCLVNRLWFLEVNLFFSRPNPLARPTASAAPACFPTNTVGPAAELSATGKSVLCSLAGELINFLDAV